MSMSDAAENDNETEETINEAYVSDKQAGQYQNNAIYSQSEVILNAGQTENQEHVIFIFGKYLPVPSSTCTKKQLDHFKRYFIFFMDELAEKKYFLFYFHSGLSSYSYAQCLYIILKRLPQKYYNNLQKLFIVHPSFLLKSYNFFSAPNILKPKIQYLKSLRDVYELSFFKKTFYKKIQTYVREKSHFRQPHLSRSDDEEERNRDKYRLFGLSLDDMELHEDKQIPVVIVELINYFKSSNEHLDEQGIFRKAPREYDIKELEKQLILKNYKALDLCDDPHIVAELSSEVRVNRVISIVQNMPELNSRVLWSLIDLLKLVQQHSDKNLMKIDALTRIIAPALIRRNVNNYMDNPNKSSANDEDIKLREAIEELKMNPTIVDLTKILFLHFDEVFQGVKKEDNPNLKNIVSSLKGEEHDINIDRDRTENQNEKNNILRQQQEEENNIQSNQASEQKQQHSSPSQQNRNSDNKQSITGDSNSEGKFDFQQNYFSNYKGDFKCLSSDRVRRFSRIHFNKASDDLQEDPKGGSVWESKEKEQDHSKEISQGDDSNKMNKEKNLENEQLNQIKGQSHQGQQTNEGNEKTQEYEKEQFSELYGHHRRGIIDDNKNILLDQSHTQLNEQDNYDHTISQSIQNNTIEDNAQISQEDERIQRSGVRQKSLAISITDPQQLKLIQESIQNS